MKFSKIIWFCFSAVVMLGLGMISCQKLDRPELGELILDPDPPAYEPLKSLWAFEGNATDQGENGFTPTTSNVSYGTGISGQALQIGADGYLLLKATGDTTRYPNGFVGLPFDSIVNIGSFTISFWMNGTGPIAGGAQGIFSISNKNQFWGNLDIFLENWSNAGDPNEAWIKIHMFNSNAANGTGEEWTADDNVKIPNTLGKWSHIVLTYNATDSKLSIYKDGALHYSRTLGGGNYGKIKYKDFNGIVIGTHQFQTTPSLTNHGPEGWAKSFNGSLDQFRIYNKALSAGEITQLFTDKK